MNSSQVDETCTSFPLKTWIEMKWNGTYLSEPTINTSLLTVMFFPFPHPTSRPTDPAGWAWRNRSTIGQACIIVSKLILSLVLFFCGFVSSFTLNRVAEKWPAISWYTSCTFCCSYSSAIVCWMIWLDVIWFDLIWFDWTWTVGENVSLDVVLKPSETRDWSTIQSSRTSTPT